MNIWEYAVYGYGGFGQNEHVVGVVRAESKEHAETLVKASLEDEVDIKSIQVSKLTISENSSTCPVVIMGRWNDE